MIIKKIKLIKMQYVKRQIPHVNPLQYSVNSSNDLVIKIQ